MRAILSDDRLHPAIRERVGTLHADLIAEVEAAIAAHRAVVIGLAWNPHVKEARKALTALGIDFKYLEYGNYLGQWRRRNALKMWTGWPTFPMVFVDGVLVGGASDLDALIEAGALTADG